MGVARPRVFLVVQKSIHGLLAHPRVESWKFVESMLLFMKVFLCVGRGIHASTG